jgi:mannose-6-phosphate isomerase-like protein (cupin superfamily)
MLNIIKTTDIDEENLKNTKPSQSNPLDDFDFSKVIVRKPWGHEYLFYSGNGLAAWILHIKKDSMTSMHCHVDKKTFLIVLSGKAICTSLKGSYELSEGDGVIIEKKSFHSTKAVSENGVILMEIENPIKKTDLVRLNDSYGRESKGYELQNEMCFDLSMYERVFLNEEKINLNKKIGNMNICIKYFNDNHTLKSYLERHRNSISFVLSGEIIDKKNCKIYSNGEIVAIKDFEDIKNIYIEKQVKIFHITKNIMDFD